MLGIFSQSCGRVIKMVLIIFMIMLGVRKSYQKKDEGSTDIDIDGEIK